MFKMYIHRAPSPAARRDLRSKEPEHPELESPAPRSRAEIHPVQSQAKHLAWQDNFTCGHQQALHQR